MAISKNSLQFAASEREPHYGLRKLNVGLASVLLGTTIYLGQANLAHADTVNAAESNQPATTQVVNNNNQQSSNDNVQQHDAVTNANQIKAKTVNQPVSQPTTSAGVQSVASQAVGQPSVSQNNNAIAAHTIVKHVTNQQSSASTASAGTNSANQTNQLVNQQPRAINQNAQVNSTNASTNLGTVSNEQKSTEQVPEVAKLNASIHQNNVKAAQQIDQNQLTDAQKLVRALNQSLYGYHYGGATTATVTKPGSDTTQPSKPVVKYGLVSFRVVDGDTNRSYGFIYRYGKVGSMYSVSSWEIAAQAGKNADQISVSDVYGYIFEYGGSITIYFHHKHNVGVAYSNVSFSAGGKTTVAQLKYKKDTDLFNARTKYTLLSSTPLHGVEIGNGKTLYTGVAGSHQSVLINAGTIGSSGPTMIVLHGTGSDYSPDTIVNHVYSQPYRNSDYQHLQTKSDVNVTSYRKVNFQYNGKTLWTELVPSGKLFDGHLWSTKLPKLFRVKGADISKATDQDTDKNQQVGVGGNVWNGNVNAPELSYLDPDGQNLNVQLELNSNMIHWRFADVTRAANYAMSQPDFNDHPGNPGASASDNISQMYDWDAKNGQKVDFKNLIYIDGFGTDDLQKVNNAEAQLKNDTNAGAGDYIQQPKLIQELRKQGYTTAHTYALNGIYVKPFNFDQSVQKIFAKYADQYIQQAQKEYQAANGPLFKELDQLQTNWHFLANQAKVLVNNGTDLATNSSLLSRARALQSEINNIKQKMDMIEHKIASQPMAKFLDHDFKPMQAVQGMTHMTISFSQDNIPTMNTILTSSGSYNGGNPMGTGESLAQYVARTGVDVSKLTNHNNYGDKHTLTFRVNVNTNNNGVIWPPELSAGPIVGYIYIGPDIKRQDSISTDDKSNDTKNWAAVYAPMDASMQKQGQDISETDNAQKNQWGFPESSISYIRKETVGHGHTYTLDLTGHRYTYQFNVPKDSNGHPIAGGTPILNSEQDLGAIIDNGENDASDPQLTSYRFLQLQGYDLVANGKVIPKSGKTNNNYFLDSQNYIKQDKATFNVMYVAHQVPIVVNVVDDKNNQKLMSYTTKVNIDSLNTTLKQKADDFVEKVNHEAAKQDPKSGPVYLDFVSTDIPSAIQPTPDQDGKTLTYTYRVHSYKMTRQELGDDVARRVVDFVNENDPDNSTIPQYTDEVPVTEYQYAFTNDQGEEVTVGVGDDSTMYEAHGAFSDLSGTIAGIMSGHSYHIGAGSQYVGTYTPTNADEQRITVYYD